MINGNRTALTARARHFLSAPAEYLLEHDHLLGRILDFGSGRGDLVTFLDGNIHQWDPHFHPKRPRGKFDTVACIYVLNVLRPAARRRALAQAKEYVRPGGCLYVAVRRDHFDEGPTTRGTEQYHVRLRMKSLVHRKGAFEIYVWEKPK